jgi:hypothetical protein
VVVGQNRIVFDEVHLSWTAKGYREVMGTLSRVMKTRPPVVLLTGTCGPKMQESMLGNLGLDRVRVIRARTDRPEIMYAVAPGEPVTESKVTSVFIAWFERHLKTRLVNSKSQMLIYVPVKAIGAEVAQKLGVEFFHGTTVLTEKGRLLQAFRSGDMQVLVATQAFGAGIDIGTVDVVAHVGSPRSMMEFAQEAGRAGREGKTALSVVFRTCGGTRHGADDEGDGALEMRNWLGETWQCRRSGLSEYFDGKPANCAAIPAGRLCDNCRKGGTSATSVEDDIYMQVESRAVREGGSPADSGTVASDAITPRKAVNSSSFVFSDEKGRVESPKVATSGVFKSPSSSSTSTGASYALSKAPIGPSWSYATESGVTVSPITPSKRPMDRATPPSTSGSRKRALLMRLTPVEKAGQPRMEETPTKVRVADAGESVLYADKIVPFLRVFTMRKGVCFTCVGGGALEECKRGECEFEKQIMLNEGVDNMVELMNRLGNLIKYDMRGMGYCPKCYLPTPSGERTNVFHPHGLGRDALGNEPQCMVFASVASKALTFGNQIWCQKVKSGKGRNDLDPEWLSDLMENARGSPEVSVEGFVRILKSSCATGEPWFLRVFYHMVKQAVEGLKAK